MSIRLRVVDGVLVALCAARSVEKPGDVYLDDGQHYALAEKFWNDYPQCGIAPDATSLSLIEREESNNPNREEWDRTFASPGLQGAPRS
ncbi:MAG: hypothetical protein V4529_16780 [Gemmatimonadota bacterium]